jgi:diaminopimelate epimerase
MKVATVCQEGNMKFVKMHGLGNDYIYLDCFRQSAPEDPNALAIRMSKPHFGIGSDGLVLILPSETCDARMRMFNADGSEGRMCGNALRCVVKYLYDSGLARKNHITVETLSGIKTADMLVEGGVAVGARCDVGRVTWDDRDVTAEAAGRVWSLRRVDVGSRHGVTLLPEQPDEALFQAAGPALEHAEVFPDRANIEFVTLEGPDHLRMRVWERGSGETLACGTGACASFVTAYLAGWVGRRATVSLRGGDLSIEWGEDDHVIMEGPAALAFTGEWPE